MDQDLRMKLYKDQMKAIEDDLLPFGEMWDGTDDTFVDTDGQRWAYAEM